MYEILEITAEVLVYLWKVKASHAWNSSLEFEF